jgi:hypothetical protein
LSKTQLPLAARTRPSPFLRVIVLFIRLLYSII